MFLKKIDLYIFGVLLINVFQAVLTPIIEDEAYYWMFSKHLDFGYFDHPPMVAFIIKLGTLLFSDTTLGVRFITIVFSALTLKIIWHLIPNTKKTQPYSELIFIGIVLSMPLFNLYSFITTPDTGLLFFSALFLLALNNILKKESFLNMLFFGASAALLMYSKYHGGIVILLAVIFNVKLLKSWFTYGAGFFALLLITPHIYWQYQNDFITFNFHLFQRAGGGFRLENINYYVLGTLGVLNPALVLLFFLNFKKQKGFLAENKFLIQMYLGFLVFFFVYAFRSKIEAHWVAFSIIPMSILIYILIVSNLRLVKQMKYIGIISITAILLMRIAVIIDLPLATEFHSEKADYYNAISKLANGRKVVFVNSYQQAAKYSFYENESSFSDNNVFYRKNHYDLLDIETTFNNQDVLFVSNLPANSYDSLAVAGEKTIFYRKLDNYPVFNKLEATLGDCDFMAFKTEGEATLNIYNPYAYAIDLKKQELPFRISFQISDSNYDKRYFNVFKVENIENLQPNTNTSLKVRWKLTQKIPSGKYKLKVLLRAGYLYQKVISKTYNIELQPKLN